MSYLIWMNDDGDEVKKQSIDESSSIPKGFVQRTNGNWYGLMTDEAEIPKTVEVMLPKPPPKPKSKRRKKQQQSSPGVLIKMGEDERFSVDEVTQSCNCISVERRNDGVTVLHNPMVVRRLGIKWMSLSSMLSRVELDPNTGEVRVFCFSSPDKPKTVSNILVKAKKNED